MSTTSGPDIPWPVQLPFWEAVRLSYSTYFENFADVVRASWLWLLIMAPLIGIATWLQVSWLATVAGVVTRGTPLALLSRPGVLVAVSALLNIFSIVAGVSIAVAWHRRIILGEQPGLSGGNVLSGNFWRYVWAAVLLCLLVAIPMLMLFAPMFWLLPTPAPGARNVQISGGVFFPLFILGFGGIIAGIAVALRLLLVFPARAIGDTALTFKDAWARSRRNTWRLFWGFVLTTIPPALAAQVVVLSVVGLPQPPTIVGASGDFPAKVAVVAIVMTAYSLVAMPIAIGFLSHAYRYLVQRVGAAA